MSTPTTLRPRPLYRELASLIQARRNCLSGLAPGALPNPWADKHEDRIFELVKAHMPSGSGFDSGTKIDLDRSHAGKLVFETSFHHMDESGGYDGWTEHTVTVRPSFDGFALRIGGRDRNRIKEYMYETFNYALETDLAYAFEWDRLFGKYSAFLHRKERQGVFSWYIAVSPGMQTFPPVDYPSWEVARDTAVEIMRAWEEKVNSTPASEVKA